MTEISYIELLRMAHEQLDSQSAMITKLASKLQEAQGDKISAIAKERKRWAREDLAALEIRDIEQQAKGISDFVSSIEGFSEGYIQALKEDNQ
jgi:hypothetical protein